MYSLKLLKDQFPNIEFKDDLNNIDDAFTLAAYGGHLEVCKWLMQFDPDVHIGNDCAFRLAARNGHLEVCKWLMQFNPDVHSKDDFAFRWAACNGHLEVCKWLMQFNPDVHAGDDYAFRYAACNGHLEVCKWLIELKPDYYRDFINESKSQKVKELLNYISESEDKKDTLIEKILKLDKEEERLFYYRHLIKNRDIKKFFSRFVDPEIVEELI